MDKIYDFLSAYLPNRPGLTILELGANDGADTTRIINLLALPFRYYAFEPDKRHWARLGVLACEKPFTFIPQAVGAANGEARFYRSGGARQPDGPPHADSSSLMQPTGITRFYPWMEFHETVASVITLDTFCKLHQVNEIDFLWADVQGAELDVVLGGQETFRHVRYFYTECYQNRTYYAGQPTLDELLAALPGKWHPVFRTATDVLLEQVEGYDA